MPLNLPDKLPAIDLLKEENIFVIDNSRASTQDIRPLKIVILNLMPIKITTETDLIRLLSNSPLQIEVSFMKLKSHTSKNTPIEHMKAFYRDFECMRNEKFDGMIITGAPVEHLEFEDVNYWDEIQDIFNWTRTHVTSTLYICWAAQAGLYHHYGIPKYPLDKKMFGIFEHHICEGMSKLPIFRGFDDVFFVPHCGELPGGLADHRRGRLGQDARAHLSHRASGRGLRCCALEHPCRHLYQQGGSRNARQAIDTCRRPSARYVDLHLP